MPIQRLLEGTEATLEWYRRRLAPGTDSVRDALVAFTWDLLAPRTDHFEAHGSDRRSAESIKTSRSNGHAIGAVVLGAASAGTCVG